VIAPTTAAHFLHVLRKSKLLDPSLLPRQTTGSASELAEGLVREGLLTGFQARQLLRGRWKGFYLGAGEGYRILELLGGGGTGWVYLVENVGSGLLAAAKVMPFDRATDPERWEGFWREANALASLNHANVVRLLDVVTADHDSVQVLEYLDGTDLHALTMRTGKVDSGRAVAWIVQAARGLEHLHTTGLVHGDVKPGNLFLTRAGVVKVLDLGTVRSAGSLAASGTPNFMAPEQSNGQTVDARTDLYSLGASLVFLLTGVPGGTLVNPDIPPGLHAVLERMLARDPANRYQSVEEVVRALAPWAVTPALPKASELPGLYPGLRGRQPTAPVPDTATTLITPGAWSVR